MEKPAPSDPELLAEWLGQHREPAFRALVARYAGLVHATAKRTCGDDSMAAEASQLTFITLAQKAKSLSSCASLGGWLHTTAMMQAKNLIRKSQRENRKRQLLQAAMETESPHTSNDVWKEMQPVLDDALAALSDKDREALLLRFYRSLTIREIASTLGIATDAAQKRIDRATERLRGKLTRRGVQTGGSLSAAMLGGFAADARAAIPALPVLVKKAISGVVPSSGGVTSAHPLAMLAKPVFIAAVLSVMIAAVAFSVGHSTTTAKERRAGIEDGLDDRLALRQENRNERVSARNAPPDIDWRDVGMRMLEARNSNENTESTRLWNEIMPRLTSMTAAKLSSSLDEIGRMDLAADCRDLLEDLLLDPLRRKNPELVLTHHFQTVLKPKCFPGSPFPFALMDWARRDPYAAGAWLDEQISAGTLNRVLTNDDLTATLELEAAVLSGLIPVDFAAAIQRLLSLSEAQRAIVLARQGSAIGDKDHRIYADFVRNHLAEKARSEAISAPIKDMEWNEGYTPVTNYLERIEATPVERTVCIESAASERFSRIAMERKVTRADFDELREWIVGRAPAEMNHLTGEMLGTVVRYGGLSAGRLSFEEAAEFATRYHESSGDDEVLVSFLKSCGPGADELVGSLSMRISDVTKRRDALNRHDERTTDGDRTTSESISPDRDKIR